MLDYDLIKELGVDPEKWAEAYFDSVGIWTAEMSKWFKLAIEAGRLDEQHRSSV